MLELDSLQRQVVLAAQESSPTVRLVGGTGLALLLGHRTSDDVDLFCAPGESVEPIVQAVQAAALHEGARAESVRTGPFFRRLEIVRAGAIVRVDIAVDGSPRLETSATMVGDLRVETLRDQRANKLITLLGRSELRDLVDLFFIERAGLPAIDGFQDALIKDGGMDPAWFAWALSEIKIVPLRGMLASLDPGELERYRNELKLAALSLAARA